MLQQKELGDKYDVSINKLGVVLDDQDKSASGDSDSDEDSDREQKNSFERVSGLESLIVKKTGFDDDKNHNFAITDLDEQEPESNVGQTMLDSIQPKNVAFVEDIFNSDQEETEEEEEEEEDELLTFSDIPLLTMAYPKLAGDFKLEKSMLDFGTQLPPGECPLALSGSGLTMGNGSGLSMGLDQLQKEDDMQSTSCPISKLQETEPETKKPEKSL